MNDKINPQIFSVFGVNMHIGTTSNHDSGFRTGIVAFICWLEPIVNPTNERRNGLYLRFRGAHCQGQREE
jgi:hypothetical protein